MKLILFLLISINVFAAPPLITKSKVISMTESPLVIDRAQATKIYLNAMLGSVVFISQPKATAVTVKAVKSIDPLEVTNADPNELLRTISVQAFNSQNIIEIRAGLPPSKADWQKWVQNKNLPSVRFEVTAPDSMALEIFLKKGDVKVTGWKAPIVITSQTGQITLEDITGDVTANLYLGGLKLDQIRGAVSIESFSSHLVVNDVIGKLKLRTFAGETQVKSVKGPISLNTQKGQVVTNATNGPMEIATGIAAMRIIDHKGSLKGKSMSGIVEAKVVEGGDISLESDEGNLLVTLIKFPATRVNLFSEKGEIFSPRTIEVKKSVSGRVAKGQTGTTDPKASVRLKTTAGNITLR